MFINVKWMYPCCKVFPSHLRAFIHWDWRWRSSPWGSFQLRLQHPGLETLRRGRCLRAVDWPGGMRRAGRPRPDSARQRCSWWKDPSWTLQTWEHVTDRSDQIKYHTYMSYYHTADLGTRHRPLRSDQISPKCVIWSYWILDLSTRWNGEVYMYLQWRSVHVTGYGLGPFVLHLSVIRRCVVF